MRKPLTAALLALALAMPLARADHDESKREKKQREKIEDLTEKLERRLRKENPTNINIYLHQQAVVLLERTKRAREQDYRFDRLAHATDALLEASQRVFEANEADDDDDCDEDDRRETALDLQHDYFRVQQAEYFAKLSREKEAKAYVTYARALYQQARQAYDAGEFCKAKKLGEAASYIARALEYLAQAAVRIPEPPPL